MTIFLKASVCVLLAVILCITLAKHEKDFSILLSLAVGCMVFTAAFGFIEPIISFIQKLEDIGKLNHEMISILVKVLGIGLLSEFVSMICADAGNAALGKTLKVLSSVVILWLALPMLHSLLDLIDDILVNV